MPNRVFENHSATVVTGKALLAEECAFGSAVMLCSRAPRKMAKQHRARHPSSRTVHHVHTKYTQNTSFLITQGTIHWVCVFDNMAWTWPPQELCSGEGWLLVVNRITIACSHHTLSAPRVAFRKHDGTARRWWTWQQSWKHTFRQGVPFESTPPYSVATFRKPLAAWFSTTWFGTVDAAVTP